MDADEHGCRVDANFAKDGEWVRSDLSSRNSSNPVSPPIAGLLVANVDMKASFTPITLLYIWNTDFDVSKRVEGNAFNFSASLKF